MADPIVAPDVATTQPNATPAPPDLTPITGAPAQPAPPSNAAVIPGDFTSSGAPQAVPAPNKTNNGGVGAGFASAASPRFAADENGTIKQTNPMPQNFKGLLGSVLGGALRGAAYGMAAEKGESGAAAAQRLNEQAQLQARQQAQQAYENKRQQERDTLNHGLITAQTVSLQQRLKMDEESHAASMTRIGLENQELMRQHRANDQGERDAMSAAKAELIAHGIAPLHELKPNKTAPAGSVADIKGKAAQSVIVQMKTHAPNIANGKLMPAQNGQDGEDSGIDLYKMEDLNKPITKPFYFKLPTDMTNPDGTPAMTDKVITPDGKTTYGDALAQIHGANARLDEENKRLANQAQQKEAALKPEETKAKIEEEKAGAKEKLAGAAEKYSQAALNRQMAQPGGVGGTPPQGYTPPSQKDLLTMPVQQLQQQLKAAGAPDTPYLGTLQNVARYDTELEKAFTNTKRKGVNQTDREQALDYITKWLNPNFSAGQSNSRVAFLRGWANGNSGDGASIRRMNTAIGHLGLLGQAAQALAQNQGSSALPFLNRLAEEYGTQTGSDVTLVYQGIANKAAAEAAGAVKGGSGSATDQEIEKAAQGFKPEWNPQQQASWLRDQMQILSEADSTLRQVFQDNMQRSPEEAGRQILSPKNQQIMNQWVHSGATPTGNAVNPNAPTGIPGSIQLSPEAQAVANRYGVR